MKYCNISEVKTFGFIKNVIGFAIRSFYFFYMLGQP